MFNRQPRVLKRLRKNQDQYKILLAEFQKSQNWEKDHLRALSERVGLSMAQIYKWNWDMRRKTAKSSGSASNDESHGTSSSCIDVDVPLNDPENEQMQPIGSMS